MWRQQTYVELTVTFQASAIDACAANHDIVHDCKNTLASHPSSVSVFNLTIVEDGSLVQLDTPTVYGSGERDLIWMEVLPARFANNILRGISQNIFYGRRDVKNSSVER